MLKRVFRRMYGKAKAEDAIATQRSLNPNEQKAPKPPKKYPDTSKPNPKRIPKGTLVNWKRRHPVPKRARWIGEEESYEQAVKRVWKERCDVYVNTFTLDPPPQFPIYLQVHYGRPFSEFR